MTPSAQLAVQRDGLALILAAMREDHDSLEQLLLRADPDELLAMATFCAFFAAQKCREQELAVPTRDLATALQTVALNLASQATPG